MRLSAIAAEIRSLVGASPTTFIEIDPLIEKYSSGLEMREQRIVREIVCSVLMSLKSEGKLEFEDREIAMFLTTVKGKFTPYAVQIRVTSATDRKIKAQRGHANVYIGGDNFGAIVGRNPARAIQSVSREHFAPRSTAKPASMVGQRNIFRSLSRWVAAGILSLTARVLAD